MKAEGKERRRRCEWVGVNEQLERNCREVEGEGIVEEEEDCG